MGLVKTEFTEEDNLPAEKVNEIQDAIIALEESGGGGMPEMQDKTITENGVYTSDYPYYGLGVVTVNTEDQWLKRAEMLMNMFAYKLHIDFSAFNVYNAWNIDYLFYKCNDLTQMTLNGKAISRGERAFSSCPNLTSVTFNCEVNDTSVPSTTSGYSTSFAYMFEYSSKDVDVLNVHFKGKPYLRGTFLNSYAKSIKITTDYDGTEGSYFYQAFEGCKEAKSIDLSGIKISDAYRCFYSCTALETINLDTSLCTAMINTFNGCKSLKTVILSSLKSMTGADSNKNLKNVIDSSCTALENFTISEEGTTIASIDLHYATNLTVESMLSIFNSLEDRHENPQTSTSAYNGVVILGDTNKNKLTEEQQSIATSKGWLLS